MREKLISVPQILCPALVEIAYNLSLLAIWFLTVSSQSVQKANH